MPTLRKLPILMALASMNIALPVYAQEDQDLSLDELVVTGTRSGTPILELAGNTGKISEEEIDLIRPDHITEVINRVSGVRYSARKWSRASDFYPFTGFNWRCWSWLIPVFRRWYTSTCRWFCQCKWSV